MGKSITYKKLVNVIEMLQSTDAENHILALNILNTWDTVDNKIALLFAYKIGNANTDVWVKEAPLAHNAIKRVHAHTKTDTFQKLFNYIVQEKLSGDQMEIFLKLFNVHLLDECKKAEYDEIEAITVTVKLKKKDDKPGEPSQVK